MTLTYKYCFVLFLLYVSTISYSQTPDSSTSKIRLFPAQYGEKNWRFLIGLDARRSFYRQAPVKINGLKLGAEYKGVHRFGLGFYWLQKDLIFRNVEVNQINASEDNAIKFDLGYFSIFYERLFLKTKHWEVSYPFHLGAGSINGSYKDTSDTFIPYFNESFATITFGSQARFFPIKWFSLKFLLGFRLVFNTHPEVRQSFNRPFFAFGFSLHLIDLYDAIKKAKFNAKEKKNSK